MIGQFVLCCDCLFRLLRLFQNALKSTQDHSVADHLTAGDRALLWLSYIHLTEFDRLPSSLYDPAEFGPARLTSRESFILPWRTAQDISTPSDILVALFKGTEWNRKGSTGAGPALGSHVLCSCSRCCRSVQRGVQVRQRKHAGLHAAAHQPPLPLQTAAEVSSLLFPGLLDWF